MDGTDGHFFINDHFHTHGDVGNISTLLIIAIIVGTLAVGLAIFEIISVISAAIKASNGENYKYPLSINFIKASMSEETHSTSEETVDATPEQATENTVEETTEEKDTTEE